MLKVFVFGFAFHNLYKLMGKGNFMGLVKATKSETELDFRKLPESAWTETNFKQYMLTFIWKARILTESNLVGAMKTKRHLMFNRNKGYGKNEDSIRANDLRERLNVIQTLYELIAEGKVIDLYPMGVDRNNSTAKNTYFFPTDLYLALPSDLGL